MDSRHVGKKGGRGEGEYPQLHFRRLVMLHSILGSNGLVTGDHLDERMTLVDVNDACLHSAKFGEDGAQVIFRRAKKFVKTTSSPTGRNFYSRYAAHEERPAEYCMRHKPVFQA
jgi:hypothetical protein